MTKITSREEVEETIGELYLLSILVVTNAGIRLTYGVLKGFMRNPQNTLNRVEESSKVDNSSLARDIVESVCRLLIGSQEKKWLSIEEIIEELEKKGYTTTITNGNNLNSQETGNR